MVINSLDNKKIKKYASLKTNKGRIEHGLFLVEGMHLVEEAFKHNLLVDILLLEGDSLSFETNLEITYVTESILKKVSNLINYSNVIGICKTFNNKEIIGDKILLLDNIQDPGNLGTIIRSACAFNIDTIVLSNDTVDLYNDKVIRSTQGMLFHMNIVSHNLMDLIPKLKENGYMILGTNVHNGTLVSDVNPSKYALIMGNEGHGVKEEISVMCDKNLYIKMNKNCESLNVGVATSILLYELNKRSL